MKKRIMMSLMVIGLVSALVGGATFAYFTDSATNTVNSIAAGTLDIVANADVDDTYIATWSGDINNLAPGESATSTITLRNAGSLAAKYNVVATPTGDLFTAQGSTGPATVTITKNSNAFSALTDTDNVLASGAFDTYLVTVTLPATADNAYQGDTGSLAINFYATQNVDGATIPTTAVTP